MMTISNVTWYDSEYCFQCSGHSIEKNRRVWGDGVVYSKDRIYIMSKENLIDDPRASFTMLEIVPETLTVKLSKRSAKIFKDQDGNTHHIYEQIGPM